VEWFTSSLKGHTTNDVFLDKFVLPKIARTTGVAHQEFLLIFSTMIYQSKVLIITTLL